MTFPARPRPQSPGHPRSGGSRRALSLLVMFVAVAVAGVFLPRSVAAQELLSQRDAAYRVAVFEYNQLAQSLDQAFGLYEDAQLAFARARQGNDAAQVDQAYARFLDRGTELTRIERGLAVALGKLRSTGRLLLEALDDREEAILEQLDRTQNPQVRTALREELEDVRRRYRVVEEELAAFEMPVLEPLPELTVNPRHGPTDLRNMASFLEDRAAEYDSTIARLDREIDDRQRRIQRERSRGDLLADIARFESDRIPGGGVRPTPSPPSGVAAPADSLRITLAQLPLAEQVEALIEMRSRAVDFRDQALARAEVFRELASGGVR